MSESAYLEFMIRYRKEGPRFTLFFRPIWITAMLVLSVITVFCLLDEDAVSNAFGWGMVGFLIASSAMSVRIYYRYLSTWPLHEKYLNWDLVESQWEKTAKEPASDTDG